MKRLFILCLAIFTLGTAGSVLAQEKTNSGTILGSVVDNHKNPLDFVTVALFKSTDSSLVKTAVTDAAGKFRFELLQKGSYFIKASMMGYSKYTGNPIPINETNLQVQVGQLQLTASSSTLKEVSIVSSRPLIERKTDKLVMNVENSSVSTGSTALEVLQKAPGVSVDQNDKISMNGKQGVLILLDGKQTYMSTADITNLLRNMQSSQIESIELITNPSAKFDAAGNSGIINIKTKKSKNGGTNGSFSLGAGYGNHLRNNASVNLNHRTAKMNVYGSYNYGMNHRDQELNIDRINNGQNTDTYFSQTGNSIRKNNNHSFKAGADFFLNKNNTLGLLINGYANDGNETYKNNTLIGPSFVKTDSSVLANNLIKNNYRSLAYNINYKSVLDTSGQEISADADYSRYHGNSTADYVNHFLYGNGSTIRPAGLINNQSPSTIDIKALKIDYSLPINKSTKFEAGLKSSQVKTDNNFIFKELVNNQWENNPNRSNQFIYNENVNAAYVNLNKQFKKTSVQLGLRAEYTISKGNSITLNKVIKRDYLDFFPSIFINQALSKNNDIGLSYSRRIERPAYDDLNPFVYFLDQYTYGQGNPYLNPQYAHNFEASYTFKKRYALALNYTRVNDVITQVILPDPEKKSLYQTNENLAKNISYGANLNVPVTLFKWWEMNNNLNVFYLSFNSPNLAGKALKTGKTSFQFKSQQSFKIDKSLSGELNASYESPLEYGTLKIQSRYGIDVGLSKSLLDKKASVKLAVNDVFNTQHSKLSSTYPGLKYNLYQKNESQVARLTFTYRFGKNEIKPARKRSTGLEEEQGRLKN